MSDWIFSQIEHIRAGSRGVTNQLGKAVDARLKELEASHRFDQAKVLRIAIRQAVQLWHNPTQDEARKQLDLLRFELDELAPVIEGRFGEHINPETMQAYLYTQQAIRHFENLVRVAA